MTSCCKSFGKLDYLLQHKSHSWLLLLLSCRKTLTQNPKYKFYPAQWNKVSDGKLSQKMSLSSSQKVTPCSNNDFLKYLKHVLKGVWLRKDTNFLIFQFFTSLRLIQTYPVIVDISCSFLIKHLYLKWKESCSDFTL